MRNIAIASAVVMTLAAASASALTVNDCVSATQIYISGSSAAQNGFGVAVIADLFGGAGNAATFSSTAGNFRSYCGPVATTGSATNSGIASGTIVNIHYRAEGGSVTGVLPLASNLPIAFLNMSALTTGNINVSDLSASNIANTTVAVTVGGTSTANGPTDSFTGPLARHAIDMGVSDVEPSILTGNNFPTDYSPSVFGTVTDYTTGITKSVLFGQVFGLYVNKNNPAFRSTTINLSLQSVQNILNGTYTDWSKVPDSITGASIATSSAPITIINREAGSGSRTAVSAAVFGYPCGRGQGDIKDTVNAAINPHGFSTGEVTAIAQTVANGVTYASIDAGTGTNLTIANIDNVTPSALNAALGNYPIWTEAYLLTGLNQSAAAATLQPWLVAELQQAKSTSNKSSVVAVPNVPTTAGFTKNVATLPPTVAANGVLTNVFSRSGSTCSIPAKLNR